jgi:hypothetical protein
VIGTDVPFALLRAIADVPEAVLHRGLAHLQAAEFLYETRLFPDASRRIGPWAIGRCTRGTSTSTSASGRSMPRAGALGAGQGRLWVGGAAHRRGRHWQVPPGPGAKGPDRRPGGDMH